MRQYPCIYLYGWCLKGLGIFTFLGMTLYALGYVDTDPLGASLFVAAGAIAGLGMAAAGEGLHALMDMSFSTQRSAEALKRIYLAQKGK